VMPFGLKNAVATFQRIVNKIFKNLTGSSMEVYVDDMLLKSVQCTDHLQHLDKVFNLLRQYKVKLNPKKYTFGLASESSWDIWSLNGASRLTLIKYLQF